MSTSPAGPAGFVPAVLADSVSAAVDGEAADAGATDGECAEAAEVEIGDEAVSVLLDGCASSAP